MSREFKEKLGMKDIIVTSVLGVVCIAIRMLFMILGGIFPAAWFASHMLDAIFIGPVFMLVVAKTRRNGPVLLISLVTGIVFISSSVSVIISELIAGLLAEIVLRQGRFKSPWSLILSYIIFSFGFIGDFYQLWFHKEEFLKYSEAYMNADYLDALSRWVSTQTIFAIIASIVLGAIVGGVFGLKLMKKHFVKAGIAG